MTTCFITGANRGIGLELARHYARAGATVLATARAPSEATELAALQRAHPNVNILALDVTDESSFQRLADLLAARPIDIAIANAGVMGPRGSIADQGNVMATWAHVLAVNVSGVFQTVKAVGPSLEAAKGARLAIISSRMASSAVASGTSYVYRASKAAAANIGANFAVELAPKGIAVGVYHPGWVQTDMGGAAADIPVTTSVTGLVDRIDRLALATTGVFEDYAGTKIVF